MTFYGFHIPFNHGLSLLLLHWYKSCSLVSLVIALLEHKQENELFLQRSCLVFRGQLMLSITCLQSFQHETAFINGRGLSKFLLVRHGGVDHKEGSQVQNSPGLHSKSRITQ